jgi:hypothetical protein
MTTSYTFTTSLSDQVLTASIVQNSEVYTNLNNPNIIYSIQVNGYTSIGENAFLNYSNIQEVNLNLFLTSIGNSAFNGCTKLLSFGNSEMNLQTIGDSAFENCVLLNTITISSSVQSIGNSAFKNCLNIYQFTFGGAGSSLQTIGDSAFENCTQQSASYYPNIDVTLPSSVQSIGNSAFKECTYLSTLDISQCNISQIQDSTFYNCTNLLSSLTIPLNVVSINQNAFYNCLKLAGIIFQRNGNIETIEDSAFSDCVDLPSIEIMTTLTSIGNSAFSGCSSLSNINVLPRGYLTTIGDSAFSGCINLSSNKSEVNFSAIQSIGTSAFQGCIKLEGVTIAYTLTNLGNSAFSGCTNLSSCDINLEMLSTLGNDIFNGCTLLNGIIFPYSVNTIGDNAFNGCSNLSASINFTAPLTSIGTSAFQGCTKLDTDISFGTTLPDTITTIGDSAFSGCSSLSGDENSMELVNILNLGNNIFEGCGKLQGVSLSSSLQTIGNNAFSGCSSLITLGNDFQNATLTSMGTSVFKDCTSLTSISLPIILPQNIIPSSTFSGCTKLESFNFDSNIVEIGDNAFNGCNNLASNLFLPIVTTIGASAFQDCYSLIYQNSAPNPPLPILTQTLTTIGDNAFNGCSSLTPTADYMLLTSVTTLGTSVFQYSGLQGITLSTNPTTIGDNTFGDCRGLTSINLSFVTSIGSSAFGNCIGLQEVIFSKTSILTTIGDNAFNNTGLTSIYLPVSLTTLGIKSFFGCELTIASIPSPYITNIPTSAFSFNNLLRISLPPNLQTIDTYAFEGNSPLESVTFPNTLTTIGDSAFFQCNNLLFVTMPPTLISIGNNAFRDCSSLGKINLNNQITQIGDNVFTGCASLEYLNTPASLTTLGTNIFSNTSISICTIPSTIIEKEIEYINQNPGKGTVSEQLYNWQANTFGNSTMIIEYYYVFSPTDSSSNTLTQVDVINLINNWKLSKIFTGGAFSAYIGDSVTIIDNNAFANLENLRIISMGNQVTTIRSGAFQGSGLQYFYIGTNIDYVDNSNLTIIEDAVFNSCNIENIYIPSSVETIGKMLFYNSEKLTEITFAHNTRITKIDDYAFANCTNIQFLDIPKSVTTIGAYAFMNCNKLVNMNLHESITDISIHAFDSCALSQISLPNLNTLGINAFTNIQFTSNSPILVSASLQNNINDYFNYIDISKGDSAVEYSNYYNALTNYNYYVWVKKGMTGIANSDMGSDNHTLDSQFDGYFSANNNDAFEYGQKTNWTNRFYNEFNVNAQAKPTANTYLSDSADQNINSSYIPMKNAQTILSLTTPSLETYDASFFTYNYTLSASSGNILTQTDVINALNNDNYYNNSNTSPTGCYIILDNNINEIGPNAFLNGDGNSAFILGITFNDSLTSIGAKAFYNCSSLTGTIYFPEGLTTIGDNAFYNCRISKIYLPDTITNLGLACFAYNLITELYLPSSLFTIDNNYTPPIVTQPSGIADGAFSVFAIDNPPDMTIKIPPYDINNPPDFNNLISSPYVLTGYVALYPDTNNTITSTIVNNSINDSITICVIRHNPNTAGISPDTNIVIESSVFQNVAANLIHLQLNYIDTINENAFESLNLKIVDLNGYIPNIDPNAFNDAWDNSSDTQVVCKLSSQNAKDASNIFDGNQDDIIFLYYCHFTTSDPNGILTLNDVVTQLDPLATSVSISFDDTIQQIDNFAFYQITNINTLYISTTIFSIGEGAFQECTNLSSVQCPNKDSQLETIGIDAFNGCNLTNVQLPASLLKIGESAFLSNSNLWSITLPYRFYTTIFTRNNLYVEANNTYEKNWSPDKPDSATGKFFTFHFRLNSGKYMTYSWAKNYYIQSSIAEYNHEQIKHEESVEFWDKIGETVLDIAATVVLAVAVDAVVGVALTALAPAVSSVLGDVFGDFVGTITGALESKSATFAPVLKKVLIEKYIVGPTVEAGGEAVFGTEATSQEYTKITDIPMADTTYITNHLYRANYYGNMSAVYTLPGPSQSTINTIDGDGSWKIKLIVKLPSSRVSDHRYDITDINNVYTNTITDVLNYYSLSYNLPINVTIRNRFLQSTYQREYTLDGIIYGIEYNDIPSYTRKLVLNAIEYRMSIYFGISSTIMRGICFPGNSPIKTDQGIILIKNIKPRINTINNNTINAITKTKTFDEYLICFKKNSLGINYPSEDTLISKNHKINYNGKMIKSENMLGKNDKICKVKYNGEILYNVLLNKHSTLTINNLVCETLHPNSIVAKFYNSCNNISTTDKNKIINRINRTYKKPVKINSYKKTSSSYSPLFLTNY